MVAVSQLHFVGFRTFNWASGAQVSKFLVDDFYLLIGHWVLKPNYEWFTDVPQRVVVGIKTSDFIDSFLNVVSYEE